MLAWIETPGCPTGTFEIDDGRPGGYGWADVVAAIEKLSGRHIRTVRVQRAALTGPASLDSFVGRAGLMSPMITPGKVNELFHTNWVCDSKPFADATTWVPRIGLEAGLR